MSRSQLLQFYHDGGLMMHPIALMGVLCVGVLVAASLWGWGEKASGRRSLFFVLVGCVVCCAFWGWLGTFLGFREVAQAAPIASWDQRHRLVAQYISLSMYPTIFGALVGGVLCLVVGVWSGGLGWRRGRLDSVGMGVGGIFALVGLAGAFFVVGGISQALSVIPWVLWVGFVGALLVGVLAMGYKGRETEDGETEGWSWGAWLGAFGAPLLLGYATVWLCLSELLKALDRATLDQKQELCRNYALSAGKAHLVMWVIVGGVGLLGGAMFAMRGNSLRGRGGCVLGALLAIGVFVGFSQHTESQLRRLYRDGGATSRTLHAPRVELIFDSHAPDLSLVETEALQISADGGRRIVRLDLLKRKRAPLEKGAAEKKQGRVALQTDRRATLRVILGALRLWVEEELKKQSSPRVGRNAVNSFEKDSPSAAQKLAKQRAMQRKLAKQNTGRTHKRSVVIDWVVKREESRFAMAEIPQHPSIMRELLHPLAWPQIGGYRLQLSMQSEFNEKSKQSVSLPTLRFRATGVTITTGGKAIGAGCNLQGEGKSFPTCGLSGSAEGKSCLSHCLKKIKAMFPEQNEMRVHVADADAQKVSLLSVFEAIRMVRENKGGGMVSLFPDVTWVLDKTLSTP